jgi:hypothetical protein
MIAKIRISGMNWAKASIFILCVGAATRPACMVSGQAYPTPGSRSRGTLLSGWGKARCRGVRGQMVAGTPMCNRPDDPRRRTAFTRPPRHGDNLPHDPPPRLLLGAPPRRRPGPRRPGRAVRASRRSRTPPRSPPSRASAPPPAPRRLHRRADRPRPRADRRPLRARRRLRPRAPCASPSAPDTRPPSPSPSAPWPSTSRTPATRAHAANAHADVALLRLAMPVPADIAAPIPLGTEPQAEPTRALRLPSTATMTPPRPSDLPGRDRPPRASGQRLPVVSGFSGAPLLSGGPATGASRASRSPPSSASPTAR